jgi:hypothetical protein
MNQDLLHNIAAELNDAPDAASRVMRMAALIEDTNTRIGDGAIELLPFDSSPYGFPSWLAAMDKS